MNVSAYGIEKEPLNEMLDEPSEVPRNSLIFSEAGSGMMTTSEVCSQVFRWAIRLVP